MPSVENSFNIDREEIPSSIKILEDESGWGFFQIEMTIGDQESVVPVLPVEYGGREVYASYQKEMGLPVLALRYGSRGLCRVQVNSDLVEVEEMIRHGEEGVRIYNQKIDGDSRYDTYDIQPAVDYKDVPHNIYFKGRLREDNTPLSARISFVPFEN